MIGKSLLILAASCGALAQAPISVSTATEIELQVGNVGQIETTERGATTSLTLGTATLTLRAGEKKAIELAEMAIYELAGGVVASALEATFSSESARVTVTKKGVQSVEMVSASWSVEGVVSTSKSTCAGGPPSGVYTASGGRLYRDGVRVAGDRVDWGSGSIYPDDTGNNVAIVSYGPGENPNCQMQ